MYIDHIKYASMLHLLYMINWASICEYTTSLVVTGEAPASIEITKEWSFVVITVLLATDLGGMCVWMFKYLLEKKE